MNIYALLLTMASQGGEPASPPPPPPPSPCTDVAPESAVVALLDRMEAQGKSMKSYCATATVQKVEALSEDVEVRRGRVVVEGAVGADRKIGIAIDEYIDSTGRGSREDRRYLFRGGWLEEFDPERKQLIRRQIAREGEQVDPLRVGDGPIPVPLGQPRADVLREFAASIGQLPDAPYFAQLSASEKPLVTLRLVPRGGTDQARDVSAILVVVELESLMPRAVEVQATNGDRTRVMLRDGTIDQELTDAQRALLSPPATDGWKVDVRPLG